ncbi:glycosyltransferase [Planococcus sp. MERTA32b]|nr:glycosyltransferase [Planococcus sp. MER TA 32b]
MKVLFIVEMDGSMRGGLFLTTHDKIKTLLEEYKDFSADVFCLSVYDGKVLSFLKKKLNRKVIGRLAPEYEFGGILYRTLYVKETLTLKLLKKFGFDSLYYRKPAALLETSNYDLTSAHWGDPQGSLANYLKKRHNLPYALSLYGSDVHSVKSKGREKLIVRNMNQADAACFVSPQLIALAEEIGFENQYSRAHVINNAVDVRIFNSYNETERRSMKKELQTHPYVVGFAGNLNYIKRADCLVPMFKAIQLKADKEITFFIIGEGPMKADIQEEAAQTGLDIRLIGNIPQKDLAKYYNLMDCGVLPSRKEGYGNVVSESQACGTPVIGADIGGIPEAIADKSLLVSMDQEDFIEDFAGKVVRILENGTRVKVNSHLKKDSVDKEVQIWKEFIDLSLDDETVQKSEAYN